jgi:pyruvate/2-oxoglutarate dehydrogenase complex dihydrolipoamide dehydrogenase (E3) component
MAQAFCRFGVQTMIVQKRPLFLPREERDAAQLSSDAFARDGIEVRLNTRAGKKRARRRRPEDRRPTQAEAIRKAADAYTRTRARTRS